MMSDVVKQTKHFTFGDGTVACPECGVAMCGSTDNYCCACGGPLHSNVVRKNPELAAEEICCARRQAGVPVDIRCLGVVRNVDDVATGPSLRHTHLIMFILTLAVGGIFFYFGIPLWYAAVFALLLSLAWPTKIKAN